MIIANEMLIFFQSSFLISIGIACFLMKKTLYGIGIGLLNVFFGILILSAFFMVRTSSKEALLFCFILLPIIFLNFLLGIGLAFRRAAAGVQAGSVEKTELKEE